MSSSFWYVHTRRKQVESSHLTTITFIVSFTYCDMTSLYSTCKQVLGSIHTWDLLCVKYRVNSSLSNGLYCTKWVHSHLLFGKFLCRLESSIMGCETYISWLLGLKSSCDSSRLINRRCKWTFTFICKLVLLMTDMFVWPLSVVRVLRIIATDMKIMFPWVVRIVNTFDNSRVCVLHHDCSNKEKNILNFSDWFGKSLCTFSWMLGNCKNYMQWISQREKENILIEKKIDYYFIYCCKVKNVLNSWLQSQKNRRFKGTTKN